MKVVAAADSLKGSLTSLEAGNAVRGGILRACPDAQVTVCSPADGGIRMLQALGFGMLDENGNQVSPGVRMYERYKNNFLTGIAFIRIKG